MRNFFASRWGPVAAGGAIGLVASILQLAGNPPNMGLCVACFGRDIAGALGLHRAAVAQYLRPEIPAIVLGGFLAARLSGEGVSRGGSSPHVRFALGLCAAVGALVFLGCPWRGLLRLAGGDANALVGGLGLVLGIAAGVAFLRSGFGLGRAYPLHGGGAWLAPVAALALLVLLGARASFGPGAAVFFSETGPGAQRAAPWAGAAAGLAVGFLAQRSRFCTMGAFRDLILTRDAHLLRGVAALTGVALVVNLATGRFHAGFAGQPIAHADHVWNLLGMVLAGLAFTLAGGCPGRQLVLAGEGNADSGVFVAGLLAGAALAHNFALVSTPAGAAPAAPVAVWAGLLFCVWVGFAHRERPS
jgi:YedE family putative selenium metabolism protein